MFDGVLAGRGTGAIVDADEFTDGSQGNAARGTATRLPR